MQLALGKDYIYKRPMTSSRCPYFSHMDEQESKVRVFIYEPTELIIKILCICIYCVCDRINPMFVCLCDEKEVMLGLGFMLTYIISLKQLVLDGLQLTAL